MKDEFIKRSQALEEIRYAYEYEYPTASGAFDEFATTVVPNVLRNIPAADIVTLEDHERMKREFHSELERFKKIENTVSGFWNEMQKLATFKKKKAPTLEELLEYMEALKDEVIKEFAERLKAKGCELEETGGFLLETDDIDNVAKEMKGVRKNDT